MTIDTKRLATDAAYWDGVAPEGAEAFFCRGGDRAEGFYRGGPNNPQYWGFEGWTDHCSNPYLTDRKCIPRPQAPEAEWVYGLPGVGTRCLGRHKAFNSNFECEINGYRDGKVWFTDFSGSSEREFVYTVGQIEFRPIRTPEQRQRDELIEAIPHPGFSTKEDIADAVLSHFKDRYNLEPKP